MNPARYAEKYRRHLFESVIPFWMRHSVDREYGGFFTCLERDGTVYDTRKYVWLNGRQVWTLSKLYNEVEQNQEWLSAARAGAEFLKEHVFDWAGRSWFSLTREGKPAAYQRKPYGAAFVTMGFLEYAKASGDTAYAETARALFKRMRQWIADPGLLGRPSLAALPPTSLLADVYVVLALGLEMGDDSVVAEMLSAIDVHYEPQRRLFFENAVLDPARRTEYPEGRLICPGSIFEISWLLLKGLERCPDDAKKKMVLNALEGGLEFGWDKEYGGFYYFLDIEGRPMLQLESPMKLWWVHAEAICALAHAYTASREQRWLRWLEVVDEWTFDHFPDAEYGEWFGYLDRRGTPTHTLKGNNYKGCFHVPRAMLLSAQAMEG